ncbi:MAG TPA: MFS transporter [Actinophytocola sp.]|uniref:MFS transporter n=1 Tax=Actinophytocola sp. TaxID=1872138 RepID=UPI002DDDB16D|nr:MFS transporter [Actinophytocola sp.]HEV2781408.1 MFS transporter [Actinophytocola sp.]
MRGRGTGFRDVLAIREFRALWAAELFSLLGDQLARVALAVLVFQRTSSAALSALTYALTFVPAVLGGALLSGLADRYPRRQVLVATDLLRAALAGAMAIPSIPLPVLWALVGLLSMASAPFKAAQLALLPQILDDDRFVVGMSLRQITGQAAQLVGFASGGMLLTAVEPHAGLAMNGATFLASAALIVRGVRSRPAAAGTATSADRGAPESLAGNRQVLAVVAIVALAGLFVVPEGLAAPYGAAIGVGSLGVGLLMAADPLGSVIGAWLLGRVRIRPTRLSVVLLAAGSGVPLVLCAPGPGLAISIALWAASGAMSTAYLILTQAIVVQLVPDHRRGAVMGRIATCLYASQGLAIVAGGVAAEATGPFRAVAEAGLLGIVLVLCVGGWWRRVARPRRDLVAGSERGQMRHDQYSLLVTKGTPFQAECVEEPRADGQYSLFATADTSSQSERTKEPKIGDQYSLFATTDTSSQPEHAKEPNASDQYSLLRMRGTSSQAERGDGRVTRPLPEPNPPRNRRLGTRAPSLWRWCLSTAGGRLQVGRMATR